MGSNVSNKVCRDQQMHHALREWTFYNADAGPKDNCVTASEMATLQNRLAGIPGGPAPAALIDFAVRSFECNGFAADACVNESAYQAFSLMTGQVAECWVAALKQYKADLELFPMKASSEKADAEKLPATSITHVGCAQRDTFMVETWVPTALSPPS